jgi:Dyp-type peroxidase family
MVSSSAQSTHPDPKVVQGNIVGFNKDFQRFVFLGFADAMAGRSFLAAMEPEVASASEVRRFNALFKEIHLRGGGLGIVESSWANLGLTFHGLQVLDAPGVQDFPDSFKSGMAARSEFIGDKDTSAPAGWVAPFNQQIDAVVILASDTAQDLDAAYVRLRARIEPPGVVELSPTLDGNVRPEPNRGHEHFGFKDGISQPGIAGLTRSSKHGQDEIATGEFLIGYPDQDGRISGGAVPAPGPNEPGYPNQQATPALPSWAKDGSFVVLRRLRQSVAAFNDFVAQQATSLGVDPGLLGAKLVGRWRSGAPLERTRNAPTSLDPSASDPSITHPSILSDHHINDFDYAPDDEDGHLVPRAAHIRKVNPRSETPPGKDESNRHRILRRGIPYGPEFVSGEPPYGPNVSADQDRGLVFVCYQSSLARGFEFIQQSWANQEDFPRPADGRDSIISQDIDPRDFNLTPQNVHLAIGRWVTTTGGEYFFSPSLDAIKLLSAEPSSIPARP